MRCARAASVALTLALAATAQADEYVVREGDTCLGIVRTLFPGDRQALARLHELNPSLGPMPHTLAPGQMLRIDPARAARLTFVRPEVSSRRQTQPSWREASTGLDLYRLDEVMTRPRASAEITFRDATRLQLGGDALVVIYGAAAGLAELRKSGAVALLHGDLRLHLSGLRGERPRDLVVATPGARVATDARDVQLSVDRDRMSRISVHQGRADVAAARRQVRVSSGHGTRVADGKPPEAPRPLPAAPRWEAPGGRDLVAAYGGAAEVRLAWQPVERAAGYRLVVARDADLNDVVVSHAGEALEAVASAAPGRLHARVTAIDADGLVGLPATRVIDVLAVEARGAWVAPGTLRGTGELVVALPGLSDARVLLDGKPVQVPFVVRDVGRRQLTVAPRGGGRSIAVMCEVVAPRAELVIAAGAAEVVVRLLDQTGRPLTLDPGADLVVAGRAGTVLGPLRRSGDGFRARIERRQGGRAAAAALWEGRVIGEAREPL